VRGQVAPATSVQLAKGNYEIALRFDVPRAQLVDYDFVCGGRPISQGQVGETFDAYRTRRLYELNQKNERDRRAAASVTGAVVGAVAPTIAARGQATGPNGTATVDAQVSGQAVGQAAGQTVAEQQFPVISELAPGDVGAQRFQARVQLQSAQPMTCELRANADDPNVRVSYEVTLVRDLDAEARERERVALEGARNVRGQLTAQLQAAG
jgi:hypothetical protein